jgi:eukaryotic-like serine/threonine-protein kinase
MTLSAGSKLGPYEVLSPLGAGGMGEVYRAKDPRLGREIALKVLPTDVAQDAARRSRFEQEARSASALAHPNIVTVFDVGESDGSIWIAMELVEGKTVRDLLASGALPLRRALEIGTQVAEGLAAAHAAGIVHRDLKPENLIVSKDGYVKILDFGLAKLSERAPAAMEGPTMTAGASPGTEPGTVMGTVGYMSPEQAAGQAVDFRTDQFSFGSILYEMATGQRAFQRKTGVETLAAILREEPKSVAELNPAAPAPLRWTIDRCLAKEPDERYASTKDLARDLKSMRDHLSETSGVAASSEAPARRRRGWIVPAAGALLAGVVVGAVGLRLVVQPPKPQQVEFRQITFRRGTVSGARFSPDGKTIVYSAAWDGAPLDLFATQPESPESRSLGLASASIFNISTTGELALALKQRSMLGYETVAMLARLPPNAGAARDVMADVTGADWSPDGQQFAVARPEAGQWKLEYPPGKVLATSPGWIDHPRISPDGRRIAYAEHPQRGDSLGRVVVMDASGKRLYQSEISTTLSGLAWAPSGEEAWYTGDDLQALSPSGRSRLVLRLPGFTELEDVSRDGRVLINRSDRRRETVGLAPGETRERILTWHDWTFPSDLSADGRTFLFDEQGAATGGGSYLAYVRKTDGSPAVLLGQARALALSRDGTKMLGEGNQDPSPLLVLPTGAGTPRTVPSKGISWQWGFWAADGRHVVVQGSEPGHKSRIYLVDTETGEARAFTPEGVSLYGGTVSPDGSRLAAHGPDGKAYIYPVAGGDPVLIRGLEEGEQILRWTPEGLFFIARWGLPAAIYRFDPATGRREAWKTFAPADGAGVLNVGPVLVSDDGKSYVYSYRRVLHMLYVVTGLR